MHTLCVDVYIRVLNLYSKWMPINVWQWMEHCSTMEYRHQKDHQFVCTVQENQSLRSLERLNEHLSQCTLINHKIYTSICGNEWNIALPLSTSIKDQYLCLLDMVDIFQCVQGIWIEIIANYVYYSSSISTNRIKKIRILQVSGLTNHFLIEN